MPQERSFTEYIFSARFNEMFSAVRNYVYSNREALELYSQVVETSAMPNYRISMLNQFL